MEHQAGNVHRRSRNWNSDPTLREAFEKLRRQRNEFGLACMDLDDATQDTLDQWEEECTIDDQ